MDEALLRHPKMLAEPQLVNAVAAARAAGERIVFTNGCFDLLHPGHVDLLARARALGDRLALGLNSDHSVRALNKGPGRPVTPYAARAFVLAHLESVDWVTGFDEATPLELIQAVAPDVLVKGGDWPLERIVGATEVLARGGEVRSLPLLPGFSTTSTVERILTTCSVMQEGVASREARP